MRIGVNLSSEPFRRDRPLIAASIAVGLVLTALLGLQISLAIMQRGSAAQTRESITRLQRQSQTVSQERTRLEELLRRPANAEVLDRVVFINSLLYRKGISWTQIFSDLEGVMPYNVRLISVRPQLGGNNEVLLDMQVGAQTAAPVLEMLKRLENSPAFGLTEVHNFLPPSQTEPLYRYRVTVNYGQKP